jgi:hypothetical protein
MEEFGGLSAVEKHIELTSSGIPRIRFAGVQEPESTYGALDDEISF